MSIQQKSGQVDDKIKAEDVEQYLRQHPDFLEQNDELLACLKIPHDSGGATSLVERQVSVLRKENKKLGRKFDEMYAVARENDKLGRQVFLFTLGLMRAGNTEQIFDFVQDCLRREFSADAVTLRILAVPKLDQEREFEEFQADTVEFRQLFDTILTAGLPVCGRMQDEQKTALFGDLDSSVKSMALLPVVAGTTGYGLLAIGSFDKQRFQVGMGTLYLEQMGALLGQALKAYVDPIG